MQAVWLFVFLLASPLGLLTLALDEGENVTSTSTSTPTSTPTSTEQDFESEAVTVTTTKSPAKKVPCCRGHLRAFVHVHNCLNAGGGCCADNKKTVSGLGKVGTVNPRKVTKGNTSGNCGECYSTYGKCKIP